ALEAAGVPYEQRGAQGFYERPEVRDAIAYLRLLLDPGDRIALARVLARPPLEVELVAALSAIPAGADPLVALGAHPPTVAWARALLSVRSLVGRLGVDELFYELMAGTGHLEALVRDAGPGDGRLSAT